MMEFKKKSDLQSVIVVKIDNVSSTFKSWVHTSVSQELRVELKISPDVHFRCFNHG